MDQKKKGIYITIVIVLAVALLGSAIYLFQYFMSSKAVSYTHLTLPTILRV